MRPPVAAIAAMLLCVPVARAGSYTITFAATHQGLPVPSYDVGRPDGEAWLVTALPDSPGVGVGAGNPGYDGTPGAAFPAAWSLGHEFNGQPQYIQVDALAVAFGPDVASPGGLTVSVAGNASAASWTWDVAAPGTYTLPPVPFTDDALVFSSTMAGYDIESIAITYDPTGQVGPPIPFVGGDGGDGGGDGGGGAVPEPPSLGMGCIALFILTATGGRFWRSRSASGRRAWSRGSRPSASRTR